MDFTLKLYHKLLHALQASGYEFKTFSDYLAIQDTMPLLSDPNSSNHKVVILRHDVEERYENALQFAEQQNKMGIVGSYYFRLLAKPNNKTFIQQIVALGHEAGYHYDDLSFCKGDVDKAINRFNKNLEWLRQFAPITTITMEGAPMSRYDNRNLWKEFNYRDLGIKGEPYFDLDFSKTFYLTDTGRCWNGWKYSVRDKIPQQETWADQGFVFRTTHEIIDAATTNKLPPRLMITFHPQRWHQSFLPWAKELAWQTTKNQLKRLLVKFRE